MRWTMAAGAAILSLGTLVGTGTIAEARDGCGPGFHQNWSGWCRPNFYGPRVYDGPVRYRPIVYGPRWGYGWHRRRGVTTAAGIASVGAAAGATTAGITAGE